MSGTCRITSVSSESPTVELFVKVAPLASPHNPCPLLLLYSAIIIQLLLLLSCMNDLRPRIVCHLNVCFLCLFSFFCSLFDCSPALTSAFNRFLQSPRMFYSIFKKYYLKVYTNYIFYTEFT